MKSLFLALLFTVSLVVTAQEPLKPQQLPQKKVSNTYHGVTLEDPYQYLENLDDPVVMTWMTDNANYATSVLNQISGKEELFNKMKELVDRRAAIIFNVNITNSNIYYYLKRMPGEEIAKMYRRDGYTGNERLFFDPTKYKNTSDKIYTISSITPNISGDKIAVSVAANGSENPELLLFKESGEQYDEVLELAWGISWHLNGGSFFYSKINTKDVTDMNRLKNMSVYEHVIGTQQDHDTKVFSAEDFKTVGMKPLEIPFINYNKEISMNMLLALSVDKNLSIHLSDPKTGGFDWEDVINKNDKVVSVRVNPKHIYCLTYNDAPNYKIISIPVDNLNISQAKTVVKESESEIISDFQLTKDGLYYTTVKNGVEAKVYFLPHGTINPKELKLPFTAGQANLSVKGAEFSDIWVSIAGWTSPNKRFLYHATSNTFTHQPLSTPAEYPELKDLVAKEVLVKSHDGEMIPVSIIHNKNLKMNGQTPAAIYGYGSYGISIEPFFSPITLAYTLYGGVLAVPHVRGGGELGDAWHKAGQKTNKHNTWKDAIATAEYLIAQGYSSPEKMSIFGGSAGGIFVGRSITERPDLFVAAAPLVGCMNPVRMEETPNGPVNTPEFGTVADPKEFEGLLAMDSYHHLTPNTKYPAALITAGINDPRVIAWQPSKFAAKMQHDTSSDAPVLFLTNFKGGHGGRTTITQTLTDFSNVFSFFYWQSGHPAFKLKGEVKD
ncbi:MAG: prolyl oligopeptidase family serine peptidase [Algicola sp.]|nr:prolyl oligopeptidase family serine peptidase [Algicola sp.]